MHFPGNPYKGWRAVLVFSLLLGLNPWVSWGQSDFEPADEPAAAPVSASSGPLKHVAGVQFGQIWPAGTIGVDVDSTTAPGLFYEYSASEAFALHADFIRNKHDDKLTVFSTTAGIKANLVYYDQLVPYAFGGVGIYFVDKQVNTPPEDASSTNFGVNMGLGADLDLGNQFLVGLYLAIHNLFGSKADTSAGKVDLSGRWSGFFIRAGMRF